MQDRTAGNADCVLHYRGSWRGTDHERGEAVCICWHSLEVHTTSLMGLVAGTQPSPACADEIMCPSAQAAVQCVLPEDVHVTACTHHMLTVMARYALLSLSGLVAGTELSPALLLSPCELIHPYSTGCCAVYCLRMCAEQHASTLMLPFMAECALHSPHGHGGWRAALPCPALPCPALQFMPCDSSF